jgi:hypothetical protein
MGRGPSARWIDIRMTLASSLGDDCTAPYDDDFIEVYGPRSSPHGVPSRSPRQGFRGCRPGCSSRSSSPTTAGALRRSSRRCSRSVLLRSPMGALPAAGQAGGARAGAGRTARPLPALRRYLVRGGHPAGRDAKALARGHAGGDRGRRRGHPGKGEAGGDASVLRIPPRRDAAAHGEVEEGAIGGCRGRRCLTPASATFVLALVQALMLSSSSGSYHTSIGAPRARGVAGHFGDSPARTQKISLFDQYDGFSSPGSLAAVMQECAS